MFNLQPRTTQLHVFGLVASVH